MRKYLFGTGLLTAITGGLTLLRGLRENEPLTWRQVLAWISWGISVALVVGAIVDLRRAASGKEIAKDSPIHGNERALRKERLKRRLEE
ncbi:hypothetical protein JNB63_00640 [Microbacterium trichothecenolyticum]|jgi:hypothetical protein|uniref:NADH:ubiquinone oxidoreductase n=1 Tax=Microbacterium ureisolvens TaxID=2781186 RepID=A0ABS7HT91_9MICO|nr:MULTISPECIES: hypothetical protein [Microbacterium]MBW9108273.1 hypothetical protein [Microbacterium ureisolvens]MBW9118598.1 hypothetical protein [Microbacterium trichothecenolyticum]